MTFKEIAHTFKVNKGDYRTLKNRFGADDHDINQATETEDWENELGFFDICVALAEEHPGTFVIKTRGSKLEFIEVQDQ